MTMENNKKKEKKKISYKNSSKYVQSETRISQTIWKGKPLQGWCLQTYNHLNQGATFLFCIYYFQ